MILLKSEMKMERSVDVGIFWPKLENSGLSWKKQLHWKVYHQN